MSGDDGLLKGLAARRRELGLSDELLSKLKRGGREITAWPEETIGSESVIRRQYLAAIRAADQGDEAPLVDLDRRFTPGA